MSFRDTLRALLALHTQAQLVANVGAIDYSRDVVSQGSGGHGKHGTTTTRPSLGADVPLAVDLERVLERLLTVYTRRLDVERTGAEARPAVGDTRSKARKSQTAAVLAEVGRDPTEVAYLYGSTTEAVRKLRLRNGLDPDTGERVRRDVLTEHPRRTVERLSAESTTHPEETHAPDQGR